MAAAPSPHPAHPPEAQQHFQPHCALLQNQASPASEYRAKEEVRSPQADLKNKLQLPMLLLLSGSPVSPRILMKGLRAGGSLSLFSTCNSQPKSPCLLPPTSPMPPVLTGLSRCCPPPERHGLAPTARCCQA